MKTKIISLLTVSSFMFSCGNISNEKSKEQTETVTQEQHQHINEAQSIELNNGEKWKVDQNMITYIHQMEDDVQVFTNSKQNNYKLLANQLQKNIDLLTSNCTMEGKAHDELHKWLLPYIDLVNELSEAEGKIQAAKQFENIQTSFITFNQYFQ